MLEVEAVMAWSAILRPCNRSSVQPCVPCQICRRLSPSILSVFVSTGCPWWWRCAWWWNRQVRSRGGRALSGSAADSAALWTRCWRRPCRSTGWCRSSGWPAASRWWRRLLRTHKHAQALIFLHAQLLSYSLNSRWLCSSHCSFLSSETNTNMCHGRLVWIQTVFPLFSLRRHPELKISRRDKVICKLFFKFLCATKRACPTVTSWTQQIRREATKHSG